MALENRDVSETAVVSDQFETQLTKGGDASDTIVVSDAVSIELLDYGSLDQDNLDFSDSLSVESTYIRIVGDDESLTDVLYIGDPELYAEAISDSIVTGSAYAYTVSPFGLVSASGGNDCVTPDIGFLIFYGDLDEVVDALSIETTPTLNVVTHLGIKVTFNNVFVTFTP